MADKLTRQERDSLEWLRRLATDPSMYQDRLGSIYEWVKRQVADGAPVRDERLEALIEASDGHWKEDVFCIGGPELMALLRGAAEGPEHGRVSEAR